MSGGDDGPAQLWRRLRESPRRLLALDYDGTLAPFRVERSSALPLPGVTAALAALRDSQHTSVVVISGREAQEVAGLLGVAGIPVWGSHGYEVLDAGGVLHRTPLSGTQQEGLAAAEARLDSSLEPTRLERKPFGVALHTRGLSPDVAARLERPVARAWARLAAEHDLCCRAFNGGMELRAAGLDKGTALERVIRDHPGRLTVYIGDDDTDEDAFALLARCGGVGLRVGAPQRQRGPTAATGTLDDCAAVLALLRRWQAEETGT